RDCSCAVVTGRAMTIGLLILIISLAIFSFFLVYTLATFALIAVSLYETTLRRFARGGLRSTRTRRSLRPGISLIVPAYNEQPVIVTSVRSLLASDFDPLEIGVGDGGSAHARRGDLADCLG